MKKITATLAFLAISCDLGTKEESSSDRGSSPSSSTSTAASEDSSNGSEDTGTHGESESGGGDEEAFTEACGYSEPGWLADDAKRQACSMWLRSYCAGRPVDDCEVWFETPDAQRLGCFVGLVRTMVGSEGAEPSCSDGEERVCLGGKDSMLNRCSNCGEDERNTSVRATEGGWEIVTVENATECGLVEFVDDFDICSKDVAACACAC